MEKSLELNKFNFDIQDEIEKKIADDWVVIKFLGKGAFSSVLSVYGKKVGYIRSIKIIEKERFSASTTSLLKEESIILSKCDHPNVIKLYDTIESRKRIFMFLEYCKGSDIRSWIKEKMDDEKYLYVNEIRTIIKVVLEAVSYLHRNNIVHRDIKLGNILMYKKNNIKELKLADFGLSYQYDADSMSRFFNQKCGTLIYMAPEMIDEKMECHKPVDVWSIGIIMAQLLNHMKHPFYVKGDSTDKIKEMI